MIHQGIDHKVQRNYIHWDITTVCNYSCDYCYAMKEYSSDWNKEVPLNTIKSILNAINLSTLPVFLGLLGGEPTYSKHFDFILDWLKDNFFTKEDNRVYITTNLSRSFEWFKHLPSANTYNNKLFYLVSWHSAEANLYDFIKKIKVLLDKGYKVKVNVMLNPEPVNWEDIRILLESLNNIKLFNNNLIIHPHFVYHNEHLLYNYSPEFFDYFKDLIYVEPEFQQGSNLFNDVEIFKNNLNVFKGWRCYLNNYEIDLFGNVSKFCVQQKDNLLNNPLFFRNIKETRPVICQHNACTCDGLLKIRKESV